MSAHQLITPALLVGAYRIPAQRAATWAPVMRHAAELAQITTEQRLACWLAQLGHETGRLRWPREIWGPTLQQLRYEPETSLSRRLGNRRPGDGKRYMGRGLIQTTGLANYLRFTARARQLLGGNVPDFVVAPALLELPEWAAMSAAVYWLDRGLNAYADAGDLRTQTKRINGGFNGMADRQTLYTQALATMALAH